MSADEEKKQLIEKIMKKKARRDLIRETGKKDFDILTRKLAEARELKQKLTDQEYGVLEGMTDDKALKVLQLSKEAEKLNEEYESLKNQSKKNEDSKKALQEGMVTFEDTIKMQLNLSNTNEIIPKLNSMKDLQQRKRDLQMKLIKLSEDNQSSTNIEDGPTEKVRQDVRAEIENFARSARTTNPELAHLLAALHNTLYRVNGNPNEEYFEVHARSVVYQSRAYGKTAQNPPIQQSTRISDNLPPNPRNF